MFFLKSEKKGKISTIIVSRILSCFEGFYKNLIKNTTKWKQNIPVLGFRVILAGIILGWVSPTGLWASQEGLENLFSQDSVRVLGAVKDGNLVISAVAPNEVHFNLKAPSILIRKKADQGSERFKPSQMKLNETQFTVAGPVKAETFELRLYLCDQKESRCEKKQITVQWDASSSSLTYFDS